MKRILLAMSSEDMGRTLQELLQDRYAVTLCKGPALSAELTKTQYDGLILDLFLPGTDGLSLLERFSGALPPVVLALTQFYSRYILQALDSLGVGYVLRIPCPVREIAERMEDMFLKQEASLFFHWEAAARELLVKLGFDPELDGYVYLVYMIPRYARDRQRKLSGDLYAEVATVYNTSEGNVETAVRYAIEKSWGHGDAELWAACFPNGKRHPANKQFIAVMAQRVK